MKITHNKVGQNLNLVDGGVQTNKTEGAKKSDKKNQVAGRTAIESGASKVDVSPRAQEALRIKELAMAAPDVDTEKVARFQKMIDDGKYQVDAKAVADKMVDEHLETDKVEY